MECLYFCVAIISPQICELAVYSEMTPLVSAGLVLLSRTRSAMRLHEEGCASSRYDVICMSIPIMSRTQEKTSQGLSEVERACYFAI